MAEDLKGTQQTRVTPVHADPISALRAELDQFVERLLGTGSALVTGAAQRSPVGLNVPRMTMPNVDVRENDAAITIEAELPGMTESDVELSLRDGILTLKGEKSHKREETKDELQISERSFGSFSRSFRLPPTVDTERVEATFDNGVLKVRLPKNPEKVPQARTIPIGRGAAGHV